jgi:hypothetical protein
MSTQGQIPSPPQTAPLLAQQQALLACLWSRADMGCAQSGLLDTSPSGQRGLQAYRANAGALAERALSAAYPVLTEVISADSMAQLARALWSQHPPSRGDLAQWGQALPAFIESSDQLAPWPWMADLARLEWAVHGAASAADVAPDAASLQRLTQGDPDPDRLTLRWAPATQVLTLRWDVAPIWLAHQHAADSGERRSALHDLGADSSLWAPPHSQPLLLWRAGFRVRVQAIGAEEAAFVQAQRQGLSLWQALQTQDPGWSQWWPWAWQEGLVMGIDDWYPDSPTPPLTPIDPFL